MDKIVLMYHDVYQQNGTESGFQTENAFQYKISEREFESQIKEISNYCINNNINVVFTFDDGGISFLTIIAPILEKYNQKGIFFITTQYIDTDLFLTKEQIKELYKRGHIIGSHSHSHPRNISKLADCDLFEEWSQSKKILEAIIGEEIKIASIPNGCGNARVVSQALQAGYDLLYTSEPTMKITRFNELYLIGRYVVYDGMRKNDVMNIVTSKSRRIIEYLKWSTINLMKMILGDYYSSLKVKICLMKRI